MKLLIVAVGQRVPDWAQTAYDDYAKRFPPELKVELKAVKTSKAGNWAVMMWLWLSAGLMAWIRPFARRRTSAFACQT